MAFATRADLLARSNARRLAQLAVPADMERVPEDGLRTAIDGGDLSGYSQADQTALSHAMDAIDKALADADALILSYGIPETLQTSLLARLASTVALYYLQGTERMTEDVRKAYDGVIDTLTAHAKGTLSLTPIAPEPTDVDGACVIESGPRRYGASSSGDDAWNL